MLEQGIISPRQAMELMVTTIIATIILFVPNFTAREALQDAWISVVIATLAGIMLAFLVTTLGMRFPNQTMIQYSQDLLGKFLGKGIGLLYIWFYLHINAIIIREFGEFMKTAFMPDTPLIVFTVTIVLLAAFAVRGGLEVIARMNEWLLLLFLFTFIIISFLALGEIDLNNFKPVAEHNLLPLLRGAFAPTSWMGEIVAITMVIPYINQPGKSRRYGVGAVILVGLLLLLSIFTSVGVLGAPSTAKFQFPLLEMVRLINIAEFIERIDALVMVTWVAGVYIKISVFFYVAVLAISQWTQIQDYKPVTFPVGVILTAFSLLIFENTVELADFLSQTFPSYALYLFEGGIPLLLLITALITGKRGEKS